MNRLGKRRTAGIAVLVVSLLQVALVAALPAGAQVEGENGNPPSVECADAQWNGNYWKVQVDDGDLGQVETNVPGAIDLKGDGSWTNTTTDPVFRIVLKVGQGVGEEQIIENPGGSGQLSLDLQGLSHVTFCFTDGVPWSVTVGECVYDAQTGVSSTKVTIVLDPAADLKVTISDPDNVKITVIDGDGGSITLTRPGVYTWVLEERVSKKFIDGGEFTVADCPPPPGDADVSVEYGCTENDEFVVTFSAANASIAWTVNGSPATVTSGQAFPAGTSVAWVATANPGYAFGDDGDDVSGSFTAEDCSPDVLVSVGAGGVCEFRQGAYAVVSVTVNPAGGATVTVNGPGAYSQSASASGTLPVGPIGAYTWSAVAAEGYTFGEGSSSGSFTVADCTPPTTTTQPTTTTTQATTTTAPPTTTTTVGATVAGIQVEATTTTVAPVTAATLPFTGSETGTMALFGLIVAVAGLLVLAASSRRVEPVAEGRRFEGWDR
jgi:hypothetical protein